MAIKIEDVALMNLTGVSKRRLASTLKSDLTVVVKLGTPVSKVARQYLKMKPGGVVMVVTPGKSRPKPVGMIDPDLVVKLAKAQSSMPAATRDETSAAVALLKSIGVLRRSTRSASLRRPRKTYCVRGKHYGDGNPCSEHSRDLP